MELKDKFVFYCVLTTIYMKDVLGELECSQCLSDEVEDCAINPPPARPCEEFQKKKGPVNCMVAKRTNTSGDLIQFIRGCTSVWTGSGCMDQSENTMLCYDICSTSNCNTAKNCKVSKLKHLLVLVCAVFYISII